MTQWNREIALLLACGAFVFFGLQVIDWIFVTQNNPEPWWRTFIYALFGTVCGGLFIWSRIGAKNTK